MEEPPLTSPSAPVGVPTPPPGNVYRIFHPTDLSVASEVAFAHALKLALANRGELRIMHVDPDVPQTDWSNLPGVRETLARWGVLPPGSSKTDVARLGLHIEKILAYKEEPARSLEHYLKRHPADLLVLATRQPDVMERLVSKTVAEPLARHAGIPTLFIPYAANGFVSVHDGRVSLRNVLIEPARSLEHYLKRHPADLLVLATRQPDVMERLVSKTVAEPLARHAGIPTLFIPYAANGFVSVHDGRVSLRNVLIPIAITPPPAVAIESATRLAVALQQSPVSFTLLHVGGEEDLPAVNVVDQPGWTWERTIQAGDVVDAIVGSSKTADLVVMTTDGHHGLLDALLGSTTEQVLRQIQCPLLAIPFTAQE